MAHARIEGNLKSPEQQIVCEYRELVSEGLTEQLDEAARIRHLRAAASAFFQAGVLRHKLLFLTDIVGRIERERAACDPDCAFFERFVSRDAPNDEAAETERRYRLALALAPDFAEAKYNLALLRRRAGAFTEALHLFDGATSATLHPRAQPYAHLAANALWQSAAIHCLLRDDDAAAHAYDGALARLGNFGVDHLSIALFLRRRGRIEEAAEHFERIMPYSHLYAAEFVDPDYDDHERLPVGVDGRPCDPVIATPVSEIPGVGTIFYWWHLYVLLREGEAADIDAAFTNWAADRARPRLGGLWRRLRHRRFCLDAATSLDRLLQQKRRRA
jgi:tetratricopeptide (TPR) repeat protein